MLLIEAIDIYSTEKDKHSMQLCKWLKELKELRNYRNIRNKEYLSRDLQYYNHLLLNLIYTAKISNVEIMITNDILRISHKDNVISIDINDLAKEGE